MLLCGQLGGNGAYDDDDYADCLSAQRERVHIYFIHVICCSICAMWEHVCVPSGCLSSAMYFYLIFLPFWTFINKILWCRLWCGASVRCLIIINWVIVSN